MDSQMEHLLKLINGDIDNQEPKKNGGQVFILDSLSWKTTYRLYAVFSILQVSIKTSIEQCSSIG
ncbi:MAG: hypothetical protein ACXACY_18065 [Candidatus Hodarchaeales archaeon]|jgi:hypothetical protein